MTFAKELTITGRVLGITVALITLVSAGVGALSATFAAGKHEGTRIEVDRTREARLVLMENSFAAHLKWAEGRNNDLQSTLDALVRLECLRSSPQLVKAAGLQCEQ